MIHKDREELLSAHANDELSRTQTEFVEEHLRICADCRESLSNNVWVRSRITSLQETPIEADIADVTMSKIREQATGGWATSRLLRPAVVAAPSIMALVVPLVMRLSGTGSGAG
jgi:predicted anti-sigma-YlaC factor YlaD